MVMVIVIMMMMMMMMIIRHEWNTKDTLAGYSTHFEESAH